MLNGNGDRSRICGIAHPSPHRGQLHIGIAAAFGGAAEIASAIDAPRRRRASWGRTSGTDSRRPRPPASNRPAAASITEVRGGSVSEGRGVGRGSGATVPRRAALAASTPAAFVSRIAGRSRIAACSPGTRHRRRFRGEWTALERHGSTAPAVTFPEACHRTSRHLLEGIYRTSRHLFESTEMTETLGFSVSRRNS